MNSINGHKNKIMDTWKKAKLKKHIFSKRKKKLKHLSNIGHNFGSTLTQFFLTLSQSKTINFQCGARSQKLLSFYCNIF